MSVIEQRIYLASRSPRRRELLQQIGVRFEVLGFRSTPREDVEVDETPLANETPEIYVQRVARAKAAHGRRLLALRHAPPRLVLAADTTLDLDGRIIGKPRDIQDAIDTLTQLSGRAHRVLTAVAIACPQGANDTAVETCLDISEVHFRPLDAAEIRRYAHTSEPLDKAGAYAIQGHAAMFVEKIIGTHSGIVGLPLCATTLLLRRCGYPL